MDKEDVVLCIYAMNYYSAIEKNEIRSFAATWMGLEIVILSEDRQKKINVLHCFYMESKKNGTNELNYKTEIESQM